MSEKILWNWVGDHEFLRNDYRVDVDFNGIIFPSVEHAFQAAKTLDESEKKKFADTNLSAREAKQMGRALELRPDWDEVRHIIMMILVRTKFFNNPDLETCLLETGTAKLVMGSTNSDQYDSYWGMWINPDSSVEPDMNPTSLFLEGENRLGNILMDVRKELALYRGFNLEDFDKPKLPDDIQYIADTLGGYLPSAIDSTALACLLHDYMNRDKFNQPSVEAYDNLYKVLVNWDD